MFWCEALNFVPRLAWTHVQPRVLRAVVLLVVGGRVLCVLHLAVRAQRCFFWLCCFFFFQAEDGIRDDLVTGVQTCALPIWLRSLSAAEVSLYPQREVGERLVANFLRVAPEQVLLTNGMDEALSLLFATYLGSSDKDPGDELWFADPTFVMYPMLGQALGARVVRLQSGEDMALPVADLLAHVSPRTRMIAIANPNNPTGLAASRADLLRIAESAPDAAGLIDEAYFEFCGETLIPDLARHSNLFIARTFLKAYGLARLPLRVLIGAAGPIRPLPPLRLPSHTH